MPDRLSIVLIGAGSAVFSRGLLADVISTRDLGDWDIRLVDTNTVALSKALGLAERMITARSADEHVTVSGSTDRRDVLPGADFVVTCVGVGGRAAWTRDHETCQRFGVFQPVGDSVMPGGISRLLRTTPVLVDIARDVAVLAPDAFFFNYSNPMTANVMAIGRWSDADVVGLCHGVFHTQSHLAAMIGKPRSETSTLYAGLNHLTFITDFRWQGRDAWPEIRTKVARELAEPMDPDDIGDLRSSGTEAWHNPFSWELFQRLGAYPSAEDRHVTEFFPERFGTGDYYGKTLGVDAFSLPQILEWDEGSYRSMVDQADGTVPLDESIFERSSGEQEQLLAIIRGILTDSREQFSCNVLNRGVIPQLPADAAIEIPGVVTGRGVVPTVVPELSSPIIGVLARRLTAVSIAIEAAMTGDRDLVVEAVIADGAVVEPDRAGALTDALIEGQLEHLPRFR